MMLMLMLVLVLVLQPAVVAIHSTQAGRRGRPTQRVEVDGPQRGRRERRACVGFQIAGLAVVCLSVWPVQLQLGLSVGGCLQSVDQSGSRDRQFDRMRQASNGGSKSKRHRIATIEKSQVRSGHQTHCDERSEKEKKQQRAAVMGRMRTSPK